MIFFFSSFQMTMQDFTNLPVIPLEKLFLLECVQNNFEILAGGWDECDVNFKDEIQKEYL